MTGKLLSALSGAAVAVVLVGLAAAAETAPSLPPGFKLPHGQHDVRTAIAGPYTIDPQHSAVIARVSHLGFSMSAFRFGKVAAALQWNPAHMEKSTLTASVETASIATPVVGFAESLAGKDYLNAGAFPKATFVSTAFKPSGVRHGKVEGKLTLMGHTVPATFDVDLVGAGPGFAAGPKIGHVIGVHAVTNVDPKAIGLPDVFSDPIEIAIDAEFTNPK